ncbi:MAG: hypothetical protein LBG93_07550 [Treponema sp.]|nr:hypothetical protein [Treponema sp.]
MRREGRGIPPFEATRRATHGATHRERLSSRLNASITLISIPNFATFTTLQHASRL